MTKLEWCRKNAPDAYKDEPDEVILRDMSGAYDKAIANGLVEGQKQLSPISYTGYNTERYKYYSKILQHLSQVFGHEVMLIGGFLMQEYISDSARVTRDIDIDILNKEITDAVFKELQLLGDFFVKRGIVDHYELNSNITVERGGSATYYDANNKPVFKLDINYHLSTRGTRIANLDFGSMRVYTVEHILADKTCALISERRLRRAKDLYDIYCLTQCNDFAAKGVVDLLRSDFYVPPVNLTEFSLSDEDMNKLEHAYNKLTVASITQGRPLNKFSFDTVIKRFTVLVDKFCNLDKYCKWSALSHDFIEE